MTAPKLKNSAVIWTLAKDLGIKKISDPVNDILRCCEKKINTYIKEFPKCETLSDLLIVVAGKVNTAFYVIYCEDDLQRLQQKFIEKGEKIFANLKSELDEEVFGITFKLTNNEVWEPKYASVIDCRGDKGFRSYFTKWHELAHLLVLTDQQRLKFRRTKKHDSSVYDPEESMVDIIAGEFGFYAPFACNLTRSRELSFENIDELRKELCPESSYQAALIGFVKAWPEPCILVSCEMALKKNEERLAAQQLLFDNMPSPTPFLRATKITLNRPAREVGFRIYQNMRVPESSVIHEIHDGVKDYAEGEENLSWWESSDGRSLQDIKIVTKAKTIGSDVYAIITPFK